MPGNGSTEQIADRLQDVIQDLFEIQSAVHGYLGPETQQVLVQKVYSILSYECHGATVKLR